MSKVTGVQTLPEFKSSNNVEKLQVVLSKSNKHYVVVSGVVIMIAPDTNMDAPMWVVSMVDESTGETWSFITSQEPKALNVVREI